MWGKYHYSAGKVGKCIFFGLLGMAMSTINHMFLFAMPFDHTQLCHVLPQLRMLELSIGTVRVIKFIN